ncbi:MAG: hypothetical protein RPU34_06115 [Candidatus Sedimenticola sp. (ex Thyasira tokunagai)]
MAKTSIRKPILDTNAALDFAEGVNTPKQGETIAKGKKMAQEAGPKSGLVPEGDVRLTANIRGGLHLKLKIEAAQRRTTIGELIEELVEKNL